MPHDRYTGNDTGRKDACQFGSRYQPLHLAALGMHARVIKALVDAGADAEARDGSGCTALYMSARQLSPECVQVCGCVGVPVCGCHVCLFAC